MHWNILNSELMGLSPEAKLWLVQFAMTVGQGPSGALTAADMRKITGLSHYLFTQAWGQLKRGGYMKRKRVPSWGGRETDERYVYQLGEQTLRLPEERRPPILACWERLICDLLVGRIEPSQTVLRAGGRLLLAVLYARADEFGVVRDVGVAGLRRLTGLNENRLKIQLQKLKALEYLRVVVAGVAGTSLFGRVKGAYFLNTGHDALRIHCRPVSIFVDSGVLNYTNVGIDRLDASYVERLCGDIRRALVLPGERLLSFLRFRDLSAIGEIDYPVAQLFLELGRPEVRTYQQYKMEEYTSRLLSEHWSLVADGVMSDAPELSGLRQSISLQFRDGEMEKEGAEAKSRDKVDAVDVLLRLALLMAKDIQQGMRQFSGIPFSQMKHCILPRSHPLVSRLAVAVMSMPRDGQQASGECFVVTSLEENFRDRKTFPSESAIPLGNRYWYGLLTPPAAGPKRYRPIEPRRTVGETSSLP